MCIHIIQGADVVIALNTHVIIFINIIQGADVVIALTHMRWPNDRRVIEEVEEIDIILGGHDHDYVVEQVNIR